jgi:PilZ domain-containing protein
LVAPRGFFAARRCHELQLTAARALVSLDPDRLSSLYAQGGIGPQELAVGALATAQSDWVRQRRYPRVEPKRGISVMAITQKGKCSVEVQRLSLGGGLISADHRLPRGGEATLEWHNGLYRMRSHVVLRHMPTRELAFELLDMDMEGRGRLRRMIMDNAPTGVDSHAAVVTA